MKYVIMCGGKYHRWRYPKQLNMINNETLIERTVRLLYEAGVSKDDIVITGTEELKAYLLTKPLPPMIIRQHNTFESFSDTHSMGYWCDCFMPMDVPATYIMGDVVFSPEAIKIIVNTETDDIEFFASSPPFAIGYSKQWAEPFAFKVVNQEHFHNAIDKTKQLCNEHRFNRHPIAWEVWQVIKDTPLNQIDYANYTVINDYTCDIDKPEDIYKFEGGSEWHTI